MFSASPERGGQPSKRACQGPRGVPSPFRPARAGLLQAPGTEELAAGASSALEAPVVPQDDTAFSADGYGSWLVWVQRGRGGVLGSVLPQALSSLPGKLGRRPGCKSNSFWGRKAILSRPLLLWRSAGPNSVQALLQRSGHLLAANLSSLQPLTTLTLAQPSLPLLNHGPDAPTFLLPGPQPTQPRLCRLPQGTLLGGPW